MANNLIELLEKMVSSHQEHLENLIRWKSIGGQLQNFPSGENIDDFIRREESAIEKLNASIQVLKASGR